MVSIAIANGKGGVGKTSLSVSLAISLAEHGHKVLLVDADLGLANVDLILGVSPEKTLKEVALDGLPVGEAITEGPEGVSLLCGATGSRELADLDVEQLDALVGGVLDAGSKFDYVVFDTSSGIGHAAVAFLKAVKVVLVVTTPDPTSVIDAYATTKAVYEEKPGASVSLIVNMAESPAQGGTVFGRFKAIVGKFVNKEVALAAVVPLDSAVSDALRARRAFILDSPKCKASVAVDGLVEWLTADKTEVPVSDEKVSVLKRMRSVFAVFKKEEDAEEAVTPVEAERKEAA